LRWIKIGEALKKPLGDEKNVPPKEARSQTNERKKTLTRKWL